MKISFVTQSFNSQMLIYTFTYPTDKFEHIPGCCCDLKSPNVKVNIISLRLKSSFCIFLMFHKEKNRLSHTIAVQLMYSLKLLNPLKQGNH